MNDKSNGTGATAPGAAATAAPAAPAREPLQPVSGPQLASAIGAALAAPLARIEHLAASLRARRDLPEAEQAELDAGLSDIHRIAIQSQQVGRLAHGRLRQSHEKLALHQAVHDILLERHAAFQARGMEVRQSLRAVEVIVDAGLLVGLLGAATDWAAHQGSHLMVKLGMQNWPEHGLLVIKAVGAAAGRDPDCLAWFLVQHFAQAMEVRVDRAFDAESAQLTLEFTRTVRNLSGLTTLDTERKDSGPDTWLVASGSSRQFAGSRVLLVTDDPALQRDVARVCQRLDLRLDTVPSTSKATRACELSTPHLIVIDENLHDADFDHLHADLLQRNLRFPVIEVAPQNSGFAISSWDASSTSRIGRDSIRERLPEAIEMELGKAA